MSGAEKVAVLLLALGKPRAAKVLKRFDSEDLKILTQLAGDLAPIDASDLEGLVEEFAQKFSSGINFVGTEREVKNMLSDVMGEDLAGVMSDEQEEPGEAPERIWDKISRIKDEALRAYLGKEHPQTAAMILSRIDPGLAAKLTLNPLETVTTVTVQIVTLLTGDQEFNSPKTLAAFGLGLTLFVVTLMLNIVALRIVQKYREQYD